MKTAEIEMSPRVARTEAERYSRCASLTRVDRVIMRAYKSIARGGRIIDLLETMRAGGVDERKLPRLAICRADAQRVSLTVMPGVLRFSADAGRWSNREIRLDNFTGSHQSQSAWAGLPYIPPYIRKPRMGKYHVLWEATWNAMPTGDPYLLERLDQNLYRIVAGWDITPLEAAVLRR